MNAGSLRHRITIQRLALGGPDNAGAPVESWPPYAVDIPASVEPLSGRELIAAQAAQNESTMRFVIRWIPGMEETMRIIYGGKNWNITSIIDFEERHRWLQIMASAGLNQG